MVMKASISQNALLLLLQLTSAASRREISEKYLTTRQINSQASNAPSFKPSAATSMPSTLPSLSSEPSQTPSMAPSSSGKKTLQSSPPSQMPSTIPSSIPSDTSIPSVFPSSEPSQTFTPSLDPTPLPSPNPSEAPSRQASNVPTLNPSHTPSKQPSSRPSTDPTESPSSEPSRIPSTLPTTIPSNLPSQTPSLFPTDEPSDLPSLFPTGRPSEKPSKTPSKQPSSTPTAHPSELPSEPPSLNPTLSPSVKPSRGPSMAPTSGPTSEPSREPSQTPSVLPTSGPTQTPSLGPSATPTTTPSHGPSSQPTEAPSLVPSQKPSVVPSDRPTQSPTLSPTSSPSSEPSQNPSQSPSSQPSTSPSHFPSTKPSSGPTLRPSNEPSFQPSSEPSLDPTSLPSKSPSRTPSVLPSSEPTYGPSGAPNLRPSTPPSSSPTVLPTVGPSLTPTSVPSPEPSGLPSVSPSQTPSIPPTIASSAQPSQKPSTSPTSDPTMAPSLGPSQTPSKHPSHSPTILPSNEPSNNPSQKPSTPPTAAPSLNPTVSLSPLPSMSPSRIPTTDPSQHPTAVPTFSPTLAPSALPSATCHDVETYRGPPNGNLQCHNYQGTVCADWHGLGYNSSQVADLLNSCPVSCNVSCGSVSQVDLTMTASLSNVNDLLDDDSLDVFKEVTAEYLSEDVFQSEETNFVMDPIEIISQEAVNNGGVRLLRGLQQQGSLTILIRFVVKAVSIDIEDPGDQIASGLASPAFTLALQNSGHAPLSNAVASTNIVAANIGEVVEEDQGGSRTGALAGAIISAVAVIAALVGLTIFSQHKSRSRAFLQETSTVFENFPPRSPLASIRSPLRSPSSSFSFEVANSYASKVVLSMGSPHDASAARRSLSQNSGTTSASSQSPEAEPHPFAGVVPPMIVIGNIDSEQTESLHTRKTSDVVPGIQFSADAELVSAINDTTKPMDAALLTEFISKQVVDTENIEIGESSYDSISFERGQSFRIFSSADEDDASSSLDEGEDLEVQEILGSNRPRSDKGLASDDHLAEVRSVPFGSPGVRQNKRWNRASRPPRAPSDSPSSQRGSPTADVSSPPSMMIERGQAGSPQAIADSPLQQNWDNRSPRQAKRESFSSDLSPMVLQYHVEEQETGVVAPALTGTAPTTTRSPGLLDSLWTKVKQRRSASDNSESENSPHSRPASQNSGHVRVNSQGSNPIRSTSSQGSASRVRTGSASSHSSSQVPTNNSSHRRTNSQGSGHARTGSQGSFHVRSNSRASSASSGGRSFSEDGFLETFEAPAKGKLGIVIEQRPFKGPVITKVKDYSPLLGQVMPGDRLVNVNGTRTDNLTLGEILKLMSNGTKNWNGMIRLTVFREASSPRNDDSAPGEVSASQNHHNQHSFDVGSRMQGMMNEASYDFDRIATSSSMTSVERLFPHPASKKT